MFQDRFSHLLSYGASDQHTVRELRNAFDGLLVPGTVAAFQREGTGGFVLSLSASEAKIPYVIDPRSPLFQQTIWAPKKSHQSLATILGLPDDYVPAPESFTEELVSLIGTNWAEFNCSYRGKAGAKFEKYAQRLGQDDLQIETASPPKLVLPPYFVANLTDDPWWSVSTQLFEATCAAVNEIAPDIPCVRVVSTENVAFLEDLLHSLSAQARVVVWVSDLNELRASEADLLAYGRTVRGASERGQSLLVLYGGFFCVLLSAVGLKGMSHGIGYGESRRWVELPQSGPPPARYYLPDLHRYIRQELADSLWQSKVSRCECPVCKESPPILLDYHDLMMHSVHCRAREIATWTELSIEEAAKRLAEEQKEFSSRLLDADIPHVPFKEEAIKCASHIDVWLRAIGGLVSRD